MAHWRFEKNMMLQRLGTQLEEIQAEAKAPLQQPQAPPSESIITNTSIGGTTKPAWSST
jgi:hypothetical protein